MKILIGYASKTGNAKNCALKLNNIIEFSEIIDLEQYEKSPDDYDIVILGSGIRMGRVHKSFSRYIMKYRKSLLQRPFFVYISNGIYSQREKILETNVPFNLLKHALYADSFGGEIDISKQKGIDKIISSIAIKSISKDKNLTPPCILNKNILECAEKVKQTINN